MLYGTNFNPPQHLIDQAVTHPGHTVHSTQGADYIFSHFCGIFGATLVYFAVYCAGKAAQGKAVQVDPIKPSLT